MMVKICGITNWYDAAEAVAAGASALGFNFYPKSPRYITPEAASGITNRLPSRVLRVGVFVNETAAQIESIGKLAALHVAQLHGDEPPEDLNGHSMLVWKAFRMSPEWDSKQMVLYPAAAFLLDGPANGNYGGSGKTFSWSDARGLSARPVIIAGGLHGGNVAEAIQQARPWGVDACSRLEISPGRKDHQKVRAFVKAALSENI